MEENKKKISLIIPLIIAGLTISKSDDIVKFLNSNILNRINFDLPYDEITSSQGIIESLLKPKETEKLIDNKISELNDQQINEKNNNLEYTTLEEKKQYMINFLKCGFTHNGKKYEGFKDVQVAAIMGNIYRECGYDETEVTDPYIGLIQWDVNDRAKGLIEYADSKGTTWEDLDTQLEYILKEFYDEPDSWSGGKQAQIEFLNETNVHTATTRFLMGTEMYERYNGQSDEEVQELHPTWDLQDGWDAADSAYNTMQKENTEVSR